MNRKITFAALASILFLFVIAGTYLLYKKRHIVFYTLPQKHFCKESIDTSSILLKQLIMMDFPEIGNEDISDFQKAALLRSWVHQNVDWSSKSALIDNGKDFNLYYRHISEIFAAFFKDEGGVMCGRTAISLMKLYHLYGFTSYTLGYGKAGVMTHAVVLVRIRDDNKEILSIQDPTFDLTYIYPNGKVYDYFDFLKELTKRNHDNIKTKYGNGAKADFILHPDDNIEIYDHIIGLQDKPVAKLSNNRTKYKSNLTLNSFTNKFGDGISIFLQSEGFPPEIIYLFLFPISITGGEEADEILNKSFSLVAKNS